MNTAHVTLGFHACWLGGLILAIAAPNPNTAGKNEPRCFIADDPEVRALSRGSDSPSLYSKEMASDIVGAWVFVPSLSTAPTNAAWRQLTFESNGYLRVVFQDLTTGTTTNRTMNYIVVHRAALTSLPGKPPDLLVKWIDGNREVAVPLFTARVGFDERVPLKDGKVLKFRDIDGQEYFFQSVRQSYNR